MSEIPVSTHEPAPTEPLEPVLTDPTVPMEPVVVAAPVQPEAAAIMDGEIKARETALRGIRRAVAARHRRDGPIRLEEPRGGADKNHYRGKDASKYAHDDVRSLQRNRINGLSVVGGSWEDDGTWARPDARIKAEKKLAEATKGGRDENGREKPVIVNGTLDYDKKYSELVKPAEGEPSIFRVTGYKKAQVTTHKIGTTPYTQTEKREASPAVYTLERSYHDSEGKIQTETIRVREETLDLMINSRSRAKEDPEGVKDATIAGRARIYHRHKTEAEAMAERKRLEVVAQEEFVANARPGLITALQDIREVGDAVALDTETAEAYFEGSTDKELRKKQTRYLIAHLINDKVIDKNGAVIAPEPDIHKRQLQLLSSALRRNENVIGATYQKDPASPRITITGQSQNPDGMSMYEVRSEAVRDGKPVGGTYSVAKDQLARFLGVNIGA